MKVDFSPLRYGKSLIDKKMEYIISKQVLRSGISIGANVKEGLEAQSRRDFLKKPLKQSIG